METALVLPSGLRLKKVLGTEFAKLKAFLFNVGFKLELSEDQMWRVCSLMQQCKNLNLETRKMLIEDMLSSAENRISTFERIDSVN